MAIGVPKTMTVVTVEGVCISLGLSHSGGVGLGLGLPLVGQVVKSQNFSTGSIQRKVVKSIFLKCMDPKKCSNLVVVVGSARAGVVAVVPVIAGPVPDEGYVKQSELQCFSV